MRKPCPHCGTQISHRRLNCGSDDCRGAESAAWLARRREAHLERLRDRGIVTRRKSFTRRTREAIHERDGWTCHICGDPVDRGAVYPSPDSAVVDHVIPLRRGGSNDPDNLATAHSYCNNVKKDRILFRVA